MPDLNPHLSHQKLLLFADGELPAAEARDAQAHLVSCWTCRARKNEIDRTIDEFIRTKSSAVPPLPAADGPRALLRLRLKEFAASSNPTLWERVAVNLRRRSLAAAWSAGLLTIALMACYFLYAPRPRIANLAMRSVPDPQLTPGTALPLTRDDVCAGGMVEVARVVPGEVAKQVFAAYGITAPEPRAYEVDYLITPALGGSDNIRNFWPQPYSRTVWNAHIKDALEDHLQQLVCGGHLDLATAQRDMAADWISAYKKYFQTQSPLPEHASFTKDRPWE